MGAMSLSNLHPDFKNGLLLVVAAVPLESGFSDTSWALAAFDRRDLTAAQYGLLTAASGLGVGS